MKYFLIALILIAPNISFAQSSENIFEEVFRDMYSAADYGGFYIPEDNPPPPVPLDGGLIALLAAGGAAGYRQFKQRRKA